MTKHPTQDDLKRLVDREVHYCVSSLVHTLAGGYGMVQNRPGANATDLVDLTEQAFELSTPIPDYEEAATQAGWSYVEDEHYFIRDNDADPESADWVELCEAHDIDPYDREVYEHWIVSDWLADKLAAHGEKVDKDFAGLTVWARTCTGQAIVLDSVIAAIWSDLHNDDSDA